MSSRAPKPRRPRASRTTFAQNISGSLRTVPLSELLQVVHLSNKTGTLALDYADKRLNSRFAFAGGRVGRVLTPFAPKLGTVLKRCGATAKQLNAFQVYLFKASEATQKKLVEAGHVDLALLHQALREQVEMALLPIFHESDGAFLFHESGRPRGFVTPGVDIGKVSLDIVRRFDAISYLGAYTLNPFDRFKVVDDVGDFTRRTGDFTVQEWRVLSALFKSRTLQQIEASLDLSWDKLLKVLLLLERRGIIEQVPPHRHEIGTPLEIGDVAPAFNLASSGQVPFSFGAMRGRRTLLVLEGAPETPYVQNYLYPLQKQLDALSDANLDVVVVFLTTAYNLRYQLGGEPFTMQFLADPEGKVDRLYRRQKSLIGSLDVRNVRAWLAGARYPLANKTRLWPTDMRMPAYFLIGPSLHVERAYYGRFAGDLLRPDDAIHWSMERDSNRYYPKEIS